jgi:hypothetical protein
MKRKHTTHIQRSDTHAAALRAPDSAVRGILNRLIQAAPAPLDCGGLLSFCVGAAWLLDTAKGLLKLQRLVARLLRARKDGQKVIVFSQFTDTLERFASEATVPVRTSVVACDKRSAGPRHCPVSQWSRVVDCGEASTGRSRGGAREDAPATLGRAGIAPIGREAQHSLSVVCRPSALLVGMAHR